MEFNLLEKHCHIPIFIGGLMGSGTTMLVKTLDRHKNIAGYDETQLIQVLKMMDKQLLSRESELHTRYLTPVCRKKPV